jgi:hypothetical protein
LSGNVAYSPIFSRSAGIDDEDFKVVMVAIGELFERLAQGSIEDPKLWIAAYWLRDRLKSHG